MTATPGTERMCMCCLILPAATDEDLCTECLRDKCDYCFDCEDWHGPDDHY